MPKIPNAVRLKSSSLKMEVDDSGNTFIENIPIAAIIQNCAHRRKIYLLIEGIFIYSSLEANVSIISDLSQNNVFEIHYTEGTLRYD